MAKPNKLPSTEGLEYKLSSSRHDFFIEAVGSLPFIDFCHLYLFAKGISVPPKLFYHHRFDELMKAYIKSADNTRIDKECTRRRVLPFTSLEIGFNSYTQEIGHYRSALKFHEGIGNVRAIRGGKPHLLEIREGSHVQFSKGGFRALSNAIYYFCEKEGYFVHNGLLQFDRDFGVLTAEVPFAFLNTEDNTKHLKFELGEKNHLNEDQLEEVETWFLNLEKWGEK